MIRKHCDKKLVLAGLIAGLTSAGAAGTLALAQTAPESPQSVSMAPVAADLELRSALPGSGVVESVYPPIASDASAQVLNGLFTSGQAGVPDEVAHAYRMNSMKPLWTGDTGSTPAFKIIADLLTRAGEHGLNPANYALPEGLEAGGTTGPQQIARHDLAISRVIFTYLSDVRLGVLRPGISDKNTQLEPKVVDMQGLFAAIVSDPAMGLAAAPPPSESYQSLVRLLAVARQDMDAGEWGTVSIKDGSLRPGRKDRRVPQIADRLSAGGDYTIPFDDSGNPLVYAPDLIEAVKAFQARHGLGVDGIVGHRTVAAMNVTRAQRVEQVIANLERERWQPEIMPDRLVEVNVPAFHLVVRDGGVPVLDMDVIVGRYRRPTPIFSDTIRFVEFNPTWTVPKKLAAEDIGPHAIEDPDYLSRKGFTIYSSWKQGAEVVDPTTIDWSAYNKYNIPFRIVQAPGRVNSLGSVKFLFPNKFAVYLHDTPSKNLFNKAVRTISSGCIRVKNPRAFTSYLLSSQLEESQIDKAFARKRTRRVTLDDPVAVRLVYRTAWLGENGEPQYRADIYGRDKRLIRKLRAKGLNF